MFSGEEQTRGSSRSPRADTLGVSFSLWCSDRGQPDRHRGTQEGRCSNEMGSRPLCKFQSCGHMGGQSLVFRDLRDGSVFVFVFSIILKHISKGKIHSGSPVCLFCSLVISQRALLLLYDFSSLLPWREARELTTFPSNLTLVFFLSWATKAFLCEAEKYLSKQNM